MAVFDARQGQVLFSPVSNYYQGKALRAQIEAQNIENQISQDAIDKNLPERRVLNDEAIVGIRQAEQEAAQAELQRELLLKSATAGMQSYDANANLPEDQRRAKAQEASIAVIERMAPGSGEEIIRQIEADGGSGFDPEDTRALLADPDKYLEVQAANQKLTSDEKLIDGLVDSGYIDKKEGENLKLRIAEKKGTITGTTEFDPSADPRSNSQIGAEHQANLDEYNASSDVHELISSGLPRVKESPGSVGFRGKLAIGASGVLSTLGQDEMASAVAEAIAGNDVEAITAMQTQLQALRGRIVPLVTGEQSKRLSETEREIASKAVGLIDSITGPADLTKAYPQVIGAMKQLYEEGWATKYRIAKKDENIDYPYNLNERDEVIEFLEEFQIAGIDKESAARALTRMRMIQGIQ